MPKIIDTGVEGNVTHVFIVGVSHYRHVNGGSDVTESGCLSELDQLTSAARSASEFAAWILGEYHRPDAPLGTMHICLAPTEGEQINAHIRERMASWGATREQVEKDWNEFEELCRSNPNAIAIVYVAGHGVQLNNGGATLLLEDFGCEKHKRYVLWGAIDIVGIHDSLSVDGAASQQFWFVDTCRQRPAIVDRYEKVKPAFGGGDQCIGHCQCSPMFLAASDREVAWARVNDISLFAEALLAGLRNDAGVGPDENRKSWHVTTGSLLSYVTKRVRTEANQSVDLAGRRGLPDEALHLLKNVPTAAIEIDLQPGDARERAIGSLYDFDGCVQEPSNHTWPLRREVPAGIYALRVAAQLPFIDATFPIGVMPPTLTLARELKIRQ